MRDVGENPFRLDSPRPTIPFQDYAYNETRYRVAGAEPPGGGGGTDGGGAAGGEREISVGYEEMAGWSASRFHPAGLSNSGIAARTSERVDEDVV